MGASVDSSYFQRLSLCETLSRTLEIYSKGIAIFSQLALIFSGITALVWGCLLVVLVPAFGLDADLLSNDPTYMPNHLGSFYALIGLNLLVTVLIGAVGNGAYVRAVADMYLKQDTDLKNCLQVGVKHACVILTSSFLAFVGIALGFVLFYIPGLYLSVRWFLVNPVIVIEGLGATAALKRSWTLVSGSWCYVFCTNMISGGVLLVFQYIWKSMLGLNMLTPMGSILSAIPFIVFGPILAIVMTIMYINMRIEKEGLNAELFARNLGESDGGNFGETNYSSLINKEELQDEEAVITNMV